MEKNISKIIKYFLVTALFMPGLVVYADLAPTYDYVASSSSYHIVDDTVSSGGLLGSSASYKLQDTITGFGTVSSASTTYKERNGYFRTRDADTTYISISVPSNITMSPAIYTSGGGSGNGSASWTVTTNNADGYSFSVRSSTDPALKSTSSGFSNYATQLSGIPDYSPTEGPGAEFFAFTPEGDDIATLYRDDGVAACNVDLYDTASKCWDSVLTTDKTVASRTSSNVPDGTVTTLKFRAYAGTQISKTAGSYSATIVVTILSL